MVKAQKKVQFVLDASAPVESSIIDVADLVRYFQDRIKVEGKTNNLGSKVTVTGDDAKITVEAELPFSKRYIKYLSKKYLKKNELRDFLRVVATKKNAYELRFFNLSNEETADEE